MILYNFTKDADISQWRIADDVVMGGKSNGTISIDHEGNGIFKGAVSLENNGGFSCAKLQFDRKKVLGYSKVILKIKGDGKRYQFRIKDDKQHKHAYIYYIHTSGSWQNIEILLNEMYPTTRGVKLTIPNFSKDIIDEIAFLIANRKAESFELAINQITIK